MPPSLNKNGVTQKVLYFALKKKLILFHAGQVKSNCEVNLQKIFSVELNIKNFWRL